MTGISGLTAGSTPTGPELVHAVQGGNSRKFTFAQIVAIAHAHAISDVTGLQAAIDAKLDDSQAGAGGLAVLGAADASAVRTAAGVVIGTDVQAYSAALALYAAITPSANVQSVLSAADYAAIRTLLGLAAVATSGSAADLSTGTLPSGRLSFAAASDVRAGTNATKPIASDQLSAAAAPQTLTDAAPTAWDMSLGYNAKWTLGANRTLSTPTNPTAGWTYSLNVIQDGTGSRTVTWPASFDWGTTGAPTLTTTASKRDRITLFCTDAATPKFDAFLSGKGFS